MFTIAAKQMEAFKGQALLRFEADMLRHLGTHFPATTVLAGDAAMRRFVRLGYQRAGSYRLSSVRNVCIFLTLGALFGSGFDTDPQYPWLGDGLRDYAVPANLRLDELCDRADGWLAPGAGRPSLREGEALQSGAAQLLEELARADEAEALPVFECALPRKIGLLGRGPLADLQARARKAAAQEDAYTGAANIYCLIMLLLGQDFERDPRIEWLFEDLPPARDRIRRMYTRVMDKLPYLLELRKSSEPASYGTH